MKKQIQEEVQYTTFWNKYSEEICGAIFFVGGVALVGVLLVMGA